MSADYGAPKPVLINRDVLVDIWKAEFLCKARFYVRREMVLCCHGKNSDDYLKLSSPIVICIFIYNNSERWTTSRKI